MASKKTPPPNQNQEQKRSFYKEWVEPILWAVAVALAVRITMIEPFRIPTGSMENDLLVGDHIIANKFVYGIRTPDWIGIPYTRIGFKVPFFRTPGFRKPKAGDVVIFKYPEDTILHYVKRCIAVSGDTVEIRNKTVFINGELVPQPQYAKFIDPTVFPPYYQERDIVPSYAGNRDNYGPVRIPAPGDTFHFTESNRILWPERIRLMLYEGCKIVLNRQNPSLKAMDLKRMASSLQNAEIDQITVDGKPLSETVYTVRYNQYFMMGDNRDNSLDSRFWGFVPERHIVGEALIIWWSWNSEVPMYRLLHKIRLGRLLSLID